MHYNRVDAQMEIMCRIAAWFTEAPQTSLPIRNATSCCYSEARDRFNWDQLWVGQVTIFNWELLSSCSKDGNVGVMDLISINRWHVIYPAFITPAISFWARDTFDVPHFSTCTRQTRQSKNGSHAFLVYCTKLFIDPNCPSEEQKKLTSVLVLWTLLQSESSVIQFPASFIWIVYPYKINKNIHYL